MARGANIILQEEDDIEAQKLEAQKLVAKNFETDSTPVVKNESKYTFPSIKTVLGVFAGFAVGFACRHALHLDSNKQGMAIFIDATGTTVSFLKIRQFFRF